MQPNYLFVSKHSKGGFLLDKDNATFTYNTLDFQLIHVSLIQFQL